MRSLSSQSLTSLVRRALLVEGHSALRADRLYHLSPISGIDVFHPREFAASPDGQSSGPAEGAPKGWRRFSAVYASSSDMAPFYSLPRDMERAVSHPRDPSAAVVEVHLGVSVIRPTLLVARTSLPAIGSHRFHVYEFSREDFQPLDGGEVEWVSQRPVRPVSAWEVESVSLFLTQCGWSLLPVDDLQGLVDSVRDGGAWIDSEGI